MGLKTNRGIPNNFYTLPVGHPWSFERVFNCVSRKYLLALHPRIWLDKYSQATSAALRCHCTSTSRHQTSCSIRYSVSIYKRTNASGLHVSTLSTLEMIQQRVEYWTVRRKFMMSYIENMPMQSHCRKQQNKPEGPIVPFTWRQLLTTKYVTFPVPVHDPSLDFPYPCIASSISFKELSSYTYTECQTNTSLADPSFRFIKYMLGLPLTSQRRLPFLTPIATKFIKLFIYATAISRWTTL